jgi:hypothetical protein
MRHLTLGAIALTLCGAAAAQSDNAASPISGQIRLQWDQRHANSAGPLAAAGALLPGTVALPGDGATPATELHSSGKGWNASATLQQKTQQGVATQSRAWFNELVATHDAGAWQFSAGKKIVAWDVGYAFRPNDLVQQAERRTLVDTLDEGRPVLMAEHFDAGTAWSWVWVNPTKPSAQTGAQEPALAARVYQHQGSVDWHGFARLGAHTGGSAGAAMAWVASDAVELHASARWLERADSLAINPSTAGLVHTDPWQGASVAHPVQALIGGTWTHESQLSLLAEAWWDGTALSDSQWAAWGTRNALLSRLPTLGAPAAAAAGNLAWQADAFNASSSLRRSNLYLRLSWDHEGWQPALDLLYQPADGGRMLTAALLWKGDRVQVQGGLRATGGPRDAVLTQVPTQRQAYLMGIWSF